MMDENDQKQLFDELYKKIWEELHKRQLSNSETLDKSILSLSTAGLGFSLAFIKNVVPLDKATYVCLLHGSWWAFIIAITATLFSFHSSQRGIKKQITQILHMLVGKKDHELEGKEDIPFKITEWLGYVSTTSYIAAISLTALFIILNIKRC